MYLEHFGLREYPFSITPDTAFFFSSGSACAALNTLLVAVQTGEGFVKITGDIGTGKSLLCRQLVAGLPPLFQVAYLPNPYLDPEALFFQMALEFSAIEPGERLNKAQLLSALNDRLLALQRNGQRAVICLDEAQAMPKETLEALRLLSNLETEKRKLLQVVIFGQPELEDTLNHPSLRQLKQRIAFDYRLQALRSDEVGVYLQHRLTMAGCSRALFTRPAVWLLTRGTQRVPRLINIIAHKSLLSAFGKGAQRVAIADVRAAMNDTPSLHHPPAHGPLTLTLAVMLVLVCWWVTYNGMAA